MPMSVYPELMDKISPDDVDTSLRTIEAYIRYITERTEFAFTNTFRTTTSLGASAEALSLVLEDQVNKLSEASTQINGLAGAVESAVGLIGGKVDKEEGKGLSSNDYTYDDKKALASLLTAETFGPSGLVTFDAGDGGLPVRSCTVDVSGTDPVTIKRTGVNLICFPQPQSSISRGVSVSVTNGELILTGTASGGNGVPFPASQSNVYDNMPLGPYPAGTYKITSLGFAGQSSSDRIVFTARYADGTVVTGADGARITAVGIPDGTGQVKTFTAIAPFRIGFYCSVANGTTIDCTTKVWMTGQNETPEYARYHLDTWTYDPVTNSLTPPVMTSLAGVNNIWSDGGDVTVEYGAFLAALQAEIETLQEGGY